MAGNNSTTRFELAFLIFWIALTVGLLIVFCLRKLQVPNIIKGNKYLSAAFAGLEVVIFVLVLAALAVNEWSKQSFGNGAWIASGVAGGRDSTGRDYTYNCQDAVDGWKTSCHTIAAAGAFTLIFGMIACLTALVLCVILFLSLFGVTAADRLKPFVDILGNVQWICCLACVMIWGVSGHDVQVQTRGSGGFRLGDSWILCLVATVLAMGAALFFSGGAGETIKGGEASAPATSAGPSQTNAPPSAPQEVPFTTV